MIFDDSLRAAVSARLSAFDVRRPTEDHAKLKRAAVAICLLPRAATGTARDEPPVDDQDAVASFLLTRRAPRMSGHAGQLALPGGRVDPGETPIQTALREQEEEVGITAGHDRVLGELDPYPTRSGYLIAPVVVWLGPEVRPIANPGEVATIFRIALGDLRRPDSPEIFSIPESDRPVLRLPIPSMGTEINAPTAAVLYQFREVALEGRDTRVDHFDQPVWAWR